MKSCTFIGHKNISKEIELSLENLLTDLILNKNVTMFYVGTHGDFDYAVQKILKNLKNQYRHIDYNVVLAYFPTKKDENKDYFNTIYPECLENVPKKYAIIERNKWMIKKSNFLVCYVDNTFSNANKFKEFAERIGKKVFNLFEN